MSMEEWAAFLVSNTELTKQRIAQLQTMFQQLNPKIDDTSYQRLIIQATEQRLRFTTAFVALANVISSATRQLKTELYRKRLPTSANVILYPLVHTTTGTITFPITTSSIFDTKFGCRADFSGSQYISVADDAYMDMGSGKMSFAVWVKFTGSGTYGLFCKRNIANTTNAGFECWISTGTTVNMRIADGTNTALLSIAVTGLNDGNWHSICINVSDSTNIELLVDKVSKGTQARGAVGAVTNTRAFIFGARDNAGTIQDKITASVALFQWKKLQSFSAAQLAAYHDNGIIDTSNNNTNGITFIPFRGDELPLPDATIGLFRFF